MSQCTDSRSEEQLCYTLTSTLYILYHIKVNLTTGNAKVSKKNSTIFLEYNEIQQEKVQGQIYKDLLFRKDFFKICMQ